MCRFVIMAAMAAVASACNDFECFKAKFNKIYATEAEHRRAEATFNEALSFVSSHRADSYSVAINSRADLTHTGLPLVVPTDRAPVVWRDEIAIPASWDWRTHHAVPPVANQGQCGSPVLFASIAAVESCVAIGGGGLQQFSQAQVLNCAPGSGGQGCAGGPDSVDAVFEYIVRNGGIDTAADYPPTANNTCDTAKERRHVGKIASFANVAPNSVAQLRAAVAVGPVTVAIEADQANFMTYAAGIFTGPCGYAVDHVVLVVGYTETYWIIQNSWGSDWGMGGYMYLSSSTTPSEPAGLCGILSLASLPLNGSSTTSTL